MTLKFHFLLLVTFLIPAFAADFLMVKPGREAIVKDQPTGTATQLDRLPAETVVEKLGEAERYYSIRFHTNQIGWSYKGNFMVADPIVIGTPPAVPEPASAATLLARTDVLKIIVIDVEVGDATLIICPEENGRRDAILIDTGENDSDR